MRDLLAKPLIVVTGKGGVGKSTVAAALGVAAAARGLRTIVAEVAARDDVSRALAGSTGSVFVERVVGDGLHHISIDPESALEEYLRDQLPRGVAEMIGSSRMFAYFTAATPGLRELLTIGKVWELAQPDRRTPGAHPYDLVILDAPATGHGVAVHRDPVPGGGRVEDDQVVGMGARRAPVGLGQLPDLADRQQLAQPRRGGGEVGEHPARPDHLGHAAGQLVAQVLLQRRLGID